MRNQRRIEVWPAWATLSLLGSVGCWFAGQAHAADEPEVALPPEVRAVLDAPVDPTIDPEAPKHPADAPSSAPRTPTSSAADETSPGALLAPRLAQSASDARRLALAEPPSSFDALATSSFVTLAAGGALVLLGGLLAGIGSDERVCGLAGCVVRASDDAEDRRSAGFRLIGAGVGGGLAGAVGLASSYLFPLERGESRDSPGQLVAGFAVSAVGASLVGVAIAGASQEREYADDAPTAALVVSGVLAVGTGVLLLSTRSSGDAGEAAPALVPSVTVGLGSARAEWRF